MKQVKIELMDTKLKKLILVCKKTHNYKKIAGVGYFLISNLVDEIGIKLNIRIRKKGDGKEPIWQYMNLINSVLKQNLEIHLFKEVLIASMKKVEGQFLSAKGEISLHSITSLYEIYYTLRELDIPNLHKEFADLQLPFEQKDTSFYSSFSFATSLLKSPKDSEDRIKPLILHKIKEKEYEVQNQLNENFDSSALEYALYLKRLEHQVEHEGSGKITVKGKLKDNLVYQHSRNELLGWWILGGFILFFALGTVITYEMLLFPTLISVLSTLTLLTFSVSIFFFWLFWNEIKSHINYNKKR